MNLFKRISTSINTRFIQPYTLKHFENTRDGKKIASFKNQYKGKRCFFIGNGPSLKVEDLNILYKNKEITFAFNRIYNIFSDTSWRPNFYLSQDDKILEGCKKTVSNLDLPIKFIPVQFKMNLNINIKNAIYFNMDWYDIDNPNNLLFSDSIEKKIYSSRTGMYTAAQIAAYMGFSEIYFIGVDHHFRTSMNNNGEVVVDNSVKDYFTDEYNQDKDCLYIPNTEKSTFTYIAMKNHCEKRNIKVFNATRGGKLEVFTRVDFDSLFKND